MTEEFKKEVALENEKKKKESDKKFYGNQHEVVSTPIGVQSSKERSDTWTDNQIAKKAGVGTGSVARYNKIMKSDDEELVTELQKNLIVPLIAAMFPMLPGLRKLLILLDFLEFHQILRGNSEAVFLDFWWILRGEFDIVKIH